MISVDVQRALERELRQDAATLREQLREALRDNKVLRQRLRQVLNCVDPRCSVCASCLDAVREA